MNRAVLAAIILSSAGCRTLAPVSPLARLERRMVFHPVKYPEGDWAPVGLGQEDAWFTAEDGTRLHGWFLEHKNPRAVVLFAHGNAGHLAHRAESLRILRDRHGLSAMCFDYRGYGRSDGKPSENGLLMDARAARKWLAERTGVAETDIVLMGRSLGGGVVTELAAEDGARGLVLASTFTSLPDVGAEHVPWLSPRVVMVNRFNSVEAIERYNGPVLISHGDADELIPFEQGERLFAAAPGPKEFVRIPGGGHNDPQSEEYREALDRFIDALPPP
ncbi:MAG: alpha/beta hydrolase [Planctomycetota bacterium]|nr:MAG: alpha/beta hydrolase [Planctomycetota bacterium]REK19977.1 MAG: alpha/beta hydrolase [Planctomycetota bacterium]REK27544.1 MAG: alpha/beta hydrolase [Planctomycetota bacterium]